MADVIFWKPYDFRGTLCSKVFKVADYEFQIGFSEFRIVDLIWQTKFRNVFNFIRILFLDVSEVSVHDSDILCSA